MTDRTPTPYHPADILARRAVAWSAAVAFVTAAYFINTHPKANVNTQFALTCALAEHGTFAIDAYEGLPEFATSDKSLFGGHIYCDKSPVTPVLGVPAFLLYRLIGGMAEGDIDYARARYWTTALTIGPAAALLAALLAALFLREGVGPERAALAAVAWLTATPLWGYATLFYPYLPAGALTLAAWLLASEAWRRPGRAGTGRLFAAGLLMGLAVFALNTVAIVALAATIGLLAGPGGGAAQAAPDAKTPPSSTGWRRLWPWVAGGLVGVAGYFAYTWMLFRSFTSPYSLIADPTYRAAMARGLFGATRPRLDVAWLLTFHPARGLFFWFPVTLLAVGGLAWSLRRGTRSERLEAFVVLLAFAGFLAYNSAYYMWWGGFAYAPRHLIPALPLLALGIVPWLRSRRRWPMRLWLVVTLAGTLLNAAPVALDPQPHPGIAEAVLYRPETVRHWISPMFSQVVLFWGFGASDANWGTRLGLAHGPASLLPLALVWIAFGAWLAYITYVLRKIKSR
ncbi:MAG: hypothetical protein M1457_11785 [bacterium]|nr:hypothetical protein [bacterium]